MSCGGESYAIGRLAEFAKFAVGSFASKALIMKEPVIIRFKDLDTSDEAFVIVRYDDASVVVGLSLKSDGDMQVVMKKEHARALLEALRTAVA